MLKSLFRRPAPPAQKRRERDHAVAGRVLPLTVTENARATRLTLRIAPGGRGLKVTVPPGVGDNEVDRFLSRHEGWLSDRLSKVPERPVVRPGIKVPVKGVAHLVVHEPGKRGAARIRQGEAGPELAVFGERVHLPRRVADFLKAEAKRTIEPLVEKHCAAAGRKARSIRYKDTSSRWGSCSSDGNLSFSWRIMMAPPAVIDYLVAHEVAHLVHMDHSPRFWKVCEELCPRTKEAKAWLKRNGNALQAIAFQ